MPRVHFVKKAMKDNPAVKKGESYYWWKFRYLPKRYSRTRPTRSQLTRSEFLSTMWEIEDNLPSEITEEEAEDLMDRLFELQDQCQESFDNMPEQFQYGSDVGMRLEDRINAIEDWVAEIQGIDWELVTPEEAAQIISDSNPESW